MADVVSKDIVDKSDESEGKNYEREIGNSLV